MKLALLLTIVMIPIFLVIIFTPFLTRRTESFGVSIPEDVYDLPELKHMRKVYVIVTSLLSLIITVIFLVSSFFGEELTAGIFFPLLLVMYVIGSFFIYLPFHQQMKELKEKHPNWTEKIKLITIDTNFRKHKLTYSNLWFIIPLAISIITILLTLISFDRIPEVFPRQYGFNGEVKTWTEKSYQSVLLLPTMQIYIILVFLFVNTVIKKAKQQIDTNHPKDSLKRNIIFRRRWSLFTIITGTGSVILFTIIQMSTIFSLHKNIIMATPIIYSIIIICYALILGFTTGQGGSRLNRQTNTENKRGSNHDDDQYWKLGIFYFNKNDSSIFVEKRFGIGWTNNWAHPLSWLILFIIILLGVSIPYLLSFLAR